MCGMMLREFTRRDRIVVATKVFYPVDGDGPNQGGLSRKAIFQGIDASLSRLGMDYVDLYQNEQFVPQIRFDERDVETEHGEASEAPATERAGNR
jgi:1-deoxyxylulose-5-phosphate synthase